MNADCAFIIGSTHSICQDYAFARNNYVIVADGCSTSPDTDIGARLIVRTASQLISNGDSDDVASLHGDASRIALQWANDIGLQPQSVDATLLTATVHDDDVIIGASGDGVIILASNSGALDVYSISFPSGFPLYPAYAHQSDRLLAWQGKPQAYREIRHFQAVSGSLDLVESSTTTGLTETIRVKANDFRYVALITDGAHSFYKNENGTTSRHATSIAIEQVLHELLAFKGGHGAFVARRAKRFQKQCESNGWRHADDLALGAIYFQD